MSDEPDPAIEPIIFHAELSDPAMPDLDLNLTLPQLWHVYRAIHLGGFEDIRDVLAFSSTIMRALVNGNVSDTAASFDEVWYQFGRIFDLPEREWKTETDLAFSFCYFLLREDLINRTEAAELGRNLLEHHDRPVTPADVEAFRKRVDRWGERNNLPRPGQPRRRTIAA